MVEMEKKTQIVMKINLKEAIQKLGIKEDVEKLTYASANKYDNELKLEFEK